MSRIEDFLIEVLARLMGLQIQIDDQHITVRARNARIANAIVSRLRERAIRENDQRILAMLREAALKRYGEGKQLVRLLPSSSSRPSRGKAGR